MRVPVLNSIEQNGRGGVMIYVYAPQNHRDGIVHHTRDEAEADNEHFDRKTTE